MLSKWFPLAAIAGILATVAACTLDNPEVGDLSGPSELGTSIEMRAVPDSIVSDGFSSAIIEAVVRNANGERMPGTTVNFDIATEGATTFLDLGNLAPVNGARPAAGGVESGPSSAVSDGSGVARVRYWAPFRTDQENDTSVIITGRTQSINFANQTFRQVEIFLRAANRPSFPGSAVCGFIIEPNKAFYFPGEGIAFTATQLNGSGACAGNEIARYEWNIYESPPVYKAGREIVHAFDVAGSYTVELITTEAVTGCQEVCDATITVVSP
jgi:hypothetical protein